MKKLLYLFLALLLPALIFVFLKYAGKNEFDIPVYFEAGVEVPTADCLITYPKPYLLPDSVISAMGAGKVVANVVVFPSPDLDMDRIKSGIEDEFGPGKVWLAEGCKSASIPGCNELKYCIFLVNDPLQTVLFDKENKIRGYYDLRSREEVDRLRVELKILLEKY